MFLSVGQELQFALSGGKVYPDRTLCHHDETLGSSLSVMVVVGSLRLVPTSHRGATCSYLQPELNGLSIIMETLACFVHSTENDFPLLPATQAQSPVAWNCDSYTRATQHPLLQCCFSVSVLPKVVPRSQLFELSASQALPGSCFRIGTHCLQSEFCPCLSALGDLGQVPLLLWVSVYLKRAERLSPVCDSIWVSTQEASHNS